MTPEHRTIDLGFAPGAFPAGAHVCQIYGDEAERNTAIERFLVAGIAAGERAACYSEAFSADRLAAALRERGRRLDALRERGALTLARVRDVYFADGRFDPDRMLDRLAAFHDDAAREGYKGARMIGEMLPEIGGMAGGERLLEYESRVTALLETHPLTAVCQYEAGAFDGATIMDVLRVHPMMVVRGAVVHNPFFAPPSEVLGR